jgi:hypothetical protein
VPASPLRVNHKTPTNPFHIIGIHKTATNPFHIVGMTFNDIVGIANVVVAD